jgi:hypothetical protein
MEAQAAKQLGVESESDNNEGTVMNIRNNLKAKAMLGDLVSYCRRQKFKHDVVSHLEKVAKKIQNAHIES